MHRTVIAGVVLAGLLWNGGECPGAEEQVYPDFDLSVLAGGPHGGVPGGSVTFPARVVLHTETPEGAVCAGVRAWSIGLRATGGAAIVRASTELADIPPVFRTEGYDRTELTSGPGNEGAISAVILSYQQDIQLPEGRDIVILHLEVEAPVPDKACRDYGIEFVDGLVGSGQRVMNVLTCGESTTRKDDGGPLDNDRDGYTNATARICAAQTFIRGDVNGDGNVQISDSVGLLEALFRGQRELSCERAADLNQDDIVDLSDAVFLLNHLFRGGAPPSPPYPLCGFGDRPTSLTCVHHPACP